MSETELIHQYPSQETIRKIRRKALKFFDSDARDLPWRKEHDDNGYRTWVSEIMLQQTQVVTVKAYFLRFMKAFPTVKALAEATEEEVLKLWEGLGYYRRARSLHAAAKMIVEKHDGVFPLAEARRDNRQVHLGLSAAGNAMEQIGGKVPPLEPGEHFGQCRVLHLV